MKCGQGTIAISQLADTGSCDTLIILVEVAWPGCLVSANMLNIEPDKTGLRRLSGQACQGVS